MPTSRFLRHALLAAFVLGSAVTVAAQPRRMNAAERQARLADALTLSSAQRALVQEALGEEPGPGSLWTLAAELAPTLSDEQKAFLFTRPERPERGAMRRDGERRERARGEHPRGERRERSGDDREARRAAMQERQAAMREAMVAALDLNPRQVEQLDALREAHRAQRNARRAERQAERERGERGQRQADRQRPEPGRVPADLAEILNADQEEVWAVHQALALRLHHRGARPHGRH